MKLHPRVSQAAVDLVKRFEGFRPRAARTPDGRFTIGYGHVLSPRDSADTADISEPEAEFLLKHDLTGVAEAVEESLLTPVNDNQFAALLSFAFNIGVENFKGCSAIRLLNQGSYLQAAAAIELWRRADFNGDALVVDQLVRRRAVEKALFLAPPEGFMPLPSSVLRPSFDHSVIGAAVAWAAARERTAVSRLALEGPTTSAELATPPGLEGEPAPSAAIAAADALTARLSRILPEDDRRDEIEAPQAAEPALEPLSLESEPAPPEFTALDREAPAAEAENVADRPMPGPGPDFVAETATVAAVAAPLAFVGHGQTSAAALPTPAPRAYDPGFDLPAPPVPARPPVTAPFEPQPVTRVETAAPAPFERLRFDSRVEPAAHFETVEQAAEPPPFVVAPTVAPAVGPTIPMPAAETPVSPWRRRFRPEAGVVEPFFPDEAPSPSLFDAPMPAALSAQDSAAHAVSPFEDAFQGAAPHGYDSGEIGVTAASTPLFERPLFFAILGLVGIALFAGSIFCMMNQASFKCLLIGVVGVLAMAPSAAFFLFRFLGKPVDPASEEHASLAEMAAMEKAHADLPTAKTAPEVANDSPFDNAWRS